MILDGFKRCCVLLLALLAGITSMGQNVPLGISYQAVARDNYGKELINKSIDVKFSIISGNPLGTVVYQELHAKQITSKYGVFSLVIGTGTPTGGTYGELSQIRWGSAPHFLKVEVKFDNDFIDMGTMPFVSVPYALYAQKSLEAGPAGPKGDPGPKGDAGDPASDKQTLSFNGNNLSISGGNTVNLTTLNVPHQLTLLGDTLSILGGNKVGLTNQIQDLQLDVNNKLKITKNVLATEIDLSRYLDNTDNQALTWNAATRKLGISGNAGSIDLTELKNDADADPANELQNLSFNQSTNTLTISSGNSVVLGNMVAFRAQKTTATSAPMPLSNIDFIADQVEYNDGVGLNVGTGEFTAPSTGIYTFDVKYIDPNDGGAGRKLMLFKNGNLYDYLESAIQINSTLSRSLTIKLVASDKIKVVINTGTGTGIGTGSFSGYKVY
jgi:hypothetical protein